MKDLTEESMIELLGAIRSPLLTAKPRQLIVSAEGLEHMKALCAEDPEFRKRVLAEFPQLEGVI